MARLQQFYKDTVVKKLMDERGYKNVMQVPRIEKITINMGVGEAIGDKKVIENALTDMEKIPRTRDFRGMSPKAFDGRGNYNMGVKEQIIFSGNRVRKNRCDTRHGYQHNHVGDERR